MNKINLKRDAAKNKNNLPIALRILPSIQGVSSTRNHGLRKKIGQVPCIPISFIVPMNSEHIEHAVLKNASLASLQFLCGCTMSLYHMVPATMIPWVPGCPVGCSHRHRVVQKTGPRLHCSPEHWPPWVGEAGKQQQPGGSAWDFLPDVLGILWE